MQLPVETNSFGYAAFALASGEGVLICKILARQYRAARGDDRGGPAAAALALASEPVRAAEPRPPGRRGLPKFAPVLLVIGVAAAVGWEQRGHGPAPAAPAHSPAPVVTPAAPAVKAPAPAPVVHVSYHWPLSGTQMLIAIIVLAVLVTGTVIVRTQIRQREE
jgi:hypothetical protein